MKTFTTYDRLLTELNNKEYFPCDVYVDILEENGLDSEKLYNKETDRIKLLESVYTIMQMLANDIDLYKRTETEFVTTSAAYQYLQTRLKDIRAEIDRVKLETHYQDENGNTSSLVSYLFCN